MRLFRLMPLRVWIVTVCIYFLPLFLVKTSNILVYHILIWLMVLVPVFIFSYFYGLWGGITISFLNHLLHMEIDRIWFISESYTHEIIFRHEVFAVSVFLSVCISILSYKLKQKSLHILYLNEQRFHFFFENTTDALIMLNADGSLEKVNPAFTKLVGYSNEEMNQVLFEALFSESEGSDKMSTYFNHALQGEPVREEISLMHKDGERILLDMIAIPEFMEDKIIGICIICKNITDHKTATEVLSETTRNGNEIFDGPDKYSIIVVEMISNELPGRILNVNDVACQKLKYSKDELLAIKYDELLPSGSKYVISKQFPKLLSEGHFSARITNLDKNSNRLPVKIYVRYFKPEDRNVVFILAEDIIVQDHGWMINDIGKNLRILMAEMDISTTELAQLSGLSLTTVSNLKNSKISKPKKSTILAISDALGINPSEICNIDDL